MTGFSLHRRSPRLVGAHKRSESAQRGFVTAETALVLPTLLGLGFALAFVIAAVADRIRCADAAWEAARGLARGGSSAAAAQAVRQLAPPGASMAIDSSGGHVTVRVSTALAFGNALLPVLHVDGHAEAVCEPGTSCAGDNDSAFFEVGRGGGERSSAGSAPAPFEHHPRRSISSRHRAPVSFEEPDSTASAERRH